MASWFNVDALKGFTEKVQNALPKIDPEILEKLTLTTPELTAERQRIDQEERQKEAIRDALSGLLPWETRDPERDILVDECRDAILKLSHDKSTFFGPYPMPSRKVNVGDDDRDRKGQDDRENEADGAEVHDEGHHESNHHHNSPSAEALEKLAKLEPLPALLRDFNLNAHVGLITRLLKEDPNLVAMQSAHSGGGEHERTFWRNYFFHCAYTRYEAGLSIDEIWSDHPPVFSDAHSRVAVDPVANLHPEEGHEETITFDHHHDAATAVNQRDDIIGGKAFPAEPTTDPDAPFVSSSSKDGTSKDTSSVEASAGASEGVDFEMVPEADGTGNTGDLDNLAGDYELDELEAEIAKELED